MTVAGVNMISQSCEIDHSECHCGSGRQTVSQICQARSPDKDLGARDPRAPAAFDSADSVSSLGHPAPGSGNMLPLFTVLCDYPVLVTKTGAPGSGKTIQPIRI